MQELRSAGTWARVLAGAALALAVLAGCAEDEPSAQEQYCDAGDQLRSSVEALGEVDLLAEGTDGLEAAADDVKADLDELERTASEAAADEVDALATSIDALESALADLGGDLTQENAAGVRTAIQAVGSAAAAVYATLSDC